MLAEEVRAPADVPAFDNSAMDGFAVRAGDSGPGAVCGSSMSRAPGARRRRRSALGEACAISTGAAIPSGADAVVRVEDTRARRRNVELLGGGRARPRLRHAGDDMRAGALVLEPRRPHRARRARRARLGRLARPCLPAPVRAWRVVTTGDELVGVDEDLLPGAVRNSGAT